jgi:fatty acid desaturase
VAELLLGFVYTPLLFVRSFLRKGSPVRDPGVRRRIWAEFALMACVWALMVGTTIWFGVWRSMILFYVVPALIAGAMQSVRKYIEHMGLTGSTVLGSTRSVIPHGLWGRLLAFSLFNEPYHGVHHAYARLPQDALPEFASVLICTHPEHRSPFPSYGRALLDMIGSLRDPRVGAQWLHSRGKPNNRQSASR